MTRITRSTSAKCTEQATSICKAGPSSVSSSKKITAKKTTSIKITNPLKPPMASVRVTRSMSKSASPPVQHAKTAPPIPCNPCDTIQKTATHKSPTAKAKYISIEVPKRSVPTPSKQADIRKKATTPAKAAQKSVRFEGSLATTAPEQTSKKANTTTHQPPLVSLPLHRQHTPLQAVTPYSSSKRRRGNRAKSPSPVAPDTIPPADVVRSSAKAATLPLSAASRPSPANRRRASPSATSPARSDEEEDEEEYCAVTVSGPCTAVLVESARTLPLDCSAPNHRSENHTSLSQPVKPSTRTRHSRQVQAAPLSPVVVSTSTTPRAGASSGKSQSKEQSFTATSSQPLSPRKARKSRRRAQSASADSTRDAIEGSTSRSVSPEVCTRQHIDVQSTTSPGPTEQARYKKALPARCGKGPARAPLPIISSVTQGSEARVTRQRASTAPAQSTKPNKVYTVSSAAEPSPRRSSRKRKCSSITNYNESDEDGQAPHDTSVEYADSDSGSDSDCSDTSTPKKRQRRKRKSTSKGPSNGKVELLCPLRIKKAISDTFKAPKFLRWNPHLSQKQLDGLKHPDGPTWPENDPVFHPFVSPKKELGHGQKRIDGVKYSMHRLSFAAHNGQISSKMDVSHVMDCGVGLSGRNINALHLTQESNDDNQVRKGHHRIMQLHAQNTTDSCFGLHIETRCRKWDKSGVSQEALKQLDDLVQEELNKMKPARGQ